MGLQARQTCDEPVVSEKPAVLAERMRVGRSDLARGGVTNVGDEGRGRGYRKLVDVRVAAGIEDTESDSVGFIAALRCEAVHGV